MSDYILQAEGISKRYKMGVHNSRSLKQNINTWWKKKNGIINGAGDDHLWALKDVSFGLRQGDVLGLIGSNGAGKSTMMKIISRVVIPTEGIIKGTGRVGSLLEVGTGFHEELTGRENIFLNGTILGMKRNDVKSKFDNIVDFSGIAAFLDTPVKRYSSGMYMRLAFAVAAHLDSEILIIDEVLAVGDLDFQQKCMNKIKQIAGEEGRTIILVSHNLQTIRVLCNVGLFLNHGKVDNFGPTDQVINHYITNSNAYVKDQDFSDLNIKPGNDHIRIKRVCLQPLTADPGTRINHDNSILLTAEFTFTSKEFSDINIDFKVFNFSGDLLFNMSSSDELILKGPARATCIIPSNFLNSDSYYISINFLNKKRSIYEFSKCLSFYIEDKPPALPDLRASRGFISPHFSVELQNL